MLSRFTETVCVRGYPGAVATKRTNAATQGAKAAPKDGAATRKMRRLRHGEQAVG
jgi:hypothetical protein